MFYYRKFLEGDGFLKEKVCCGFGHREVYAAVAEPLRKTLERLITEQNVCVFLTGGMGAFDALFSAAVRQLRLTYPHIRLELVQPYLTATLQKNKGEYIQIYDEIVIPDALDGAHRKAAIPLRNRWMVEQSDVVVSYLRRDFGGAYQAVVYAQKLKKHIVAL